MSLHFLLAQRLWQAGAGLLTIFLVTSVFSAEEQGWFYSFLGLASLYTLFDLGLSVVLVQVAAHALAKSKTDNRESELLTLMPLMGWAMRRYIAISTLFVALLIPGGLLFFGGVESTPSSILGWRDAWIGLVVSTSLGLIGMPFLALIEGSGRIAETSAVRLLQGIAGSLGSWLILLLGGGLWALSMTPVLGSLVIFGWIWLRWREIFRNWRVAAGRQVGFIHEIWPLQWRVGITWFSNYILTQIYTPILLHFDGGEAAGQMGLSLAIINMLGIVAQSWVVRNIPAMAMAAARRDWVSLDRMFFRDFRFSCAVYGAGVVCLLMVRFWIGDDSTYSNRILPTSLLALLFVVGLVGHILGLLAAQLRSFRQEPLVWIIFLTALITLPCAISGAKLYGVSGIIVAILGVQMAFALPLSIWIWRRSNRILRKA